MKKHGPTSSTLILVRGLPGSGKSTFAASQCDYTHVEADMYHVIDGEYKFDFTRLRDAHAWCLREATSILADGGNVIVSNTFTRRGEMTKYIDAARSLSAKVIVIRMTGEYESIHNVPIDVIKKMSDRFEDFPGEIIAPNA